MQKLRNQEEGHNEGGDSQGWRDETARPADWPYPLSSLTVLGSGRLKSKACSSTAATHVILREKRI